MSFKQRYLDSLLSATVRPVPEPASGRAARPAWWRRFLMSLLDVPAVGELPARVALNAGPQTAAEGRAGRRRISKAELRVGSGVPQAPVPAPAAPSPMPVRKRKVPAASGPVRAYARGGTNGRRSSGAWWPAITVTCLGLLAFFLLGHHQSPPTGARPIPTHSITDGAGSVGATEPGTDEPGETDEPSPSASTGVPGQVLWKGTLTFPAHPDSNTAPVAAMPATGLVEGYGLYLCAACSPRVIGGDLLAPWNGVKPPTSDQCGSTLAAGPTQERYVPLRLGQVGCFSGSTGTVGYFTVLTTSPLSASAIIWSE